MKYNKLRFSPFHPHIISAYLNLFNARGLPNYWWLYVYCLAASVFHYLATHYNKMSFKVEGTLPSDICKLINSSWRVLIVKISSDQPSHPNGNNWDLKNLLHQILVAIIMVDAIMVDTIVLLLMVSFNLTTRLRLLFLSRL